MQEWAVKPRFKVLKFKLIAAKTVTLLEERAKTLQKLATTEI